MIFNFFPLFCVPRKGTFQDSVGHFREKSAIFAPALVASKVRSNGQTWNKRPKSLH